MFLITIVAIFIISSLATYLLLKLSFEGRRLFCQQFHDLYKLLTDRNKMIRWFNSNVNIFYHYFCKVCLSRYWFFLFLTLDFFGYFGQIEN